MDILHRDDLRRGGFAGLRETRLIQNPQLWGPHAEPGTWPGLGRWVYMSDARFMPHGDTTMHPHREIDVISLMVEGRIRHEGSLEHGQELRPFDVQVQRGGGEGFMHNEVNPDAYENRMIQFWVVPERLGEPASYRLYSVGEGERKRVYGGREEEEGDVYPASTIIDVARLRTGESLIQDSRFLAYLVTGSGTANGEGLREGHLFTDASVNFKAEQDSMLIIAWLR